MNETEEGKVLTELTEKFLLLFLLHKNRNEKVSFPDNVQNKIFSF